MKRKAVGILIALIVAGVATGLVFADTSIKEEKPKVIVSGEVNFTAQLHFASHMDDRVEMEISNYGTEEMVIASQANYIDQAGSAGSWNCQSERETKVAPGKSQKIQFEISNAVSHGDNSILAFFFQYKDKGYLGKVGINNGTEYFQNHN